MEPSSRSGAGGGEAAGPDRPLFPEGESGIGSQAPFPDSRQVAEGMPRSQLNRPHTNTYLRPERGTFAGTESRR